MRTFPLVDRYKIQVWVHSVYQWLPSSVEPNVFDTLEAAQVEIVIRKFNGSHFEYRIMDTETQKPVNSQE
jgi:hypothetical protein